VIESSLSGGKYDLLKELASAASRRSNPAHPSTLTSSALKTAIAAQNQCGFYIGIGEGHFESGGLGRRTMNRYDSFFNQMFRIETLHGTPSISNPMSPGLLFDDAGSSSTSTDINWPLMT
jgi:hypothetical protein